MNDYELLPPVDVIAPPHAVAWSPGFGFIFDADDLYEARGEGELLLDVTDATSPGAVGVVQSVEGPAPLAALVRVDRQLDELRHAHARLAERVSDIGDKQAGLDTDQSMELVSIKARVRALERNI